MVKAGAAMAKALAAKVKERRMSPSPGAAKALAARKVNKVKKKLKQTASDAKDN